jgi:hypothetical protein
MQPTKIKAIVIILIFLLIFTIFTGCIEQEQKLENEDILTPDINPDQSSILPNWVDGEYHDYYVTTQLLNDFNDKYPDLVNVFSIGESVLGRDISCIRITNENNHTIKYSCLIDGCIHGHEWEGGEACLYLAEYLLINYGKNATITRILNNSKIYIVPLVNPDGRQNNEMWVGNDNGVDLNRNFDIFFGRLRGHNYRLGKLFGRIKIPFIKFPPNKPYKWWRNCGRYPFSEPESRALRDLMISLDNHDFSFYVNCHTATHNVVTPWTVFKPPFEMKQKEKEIFNYVLDWVEDNTEYEAYREGPGNAGGLAMDWCFQEFRIPSFILEVLSLDYECFRTGEVKHDNLVHWMKTTLPFFIYLLVNIENLNRWQTPDIQPSLPEEIPPEPI